MTRFRAGRVLAADLIGLAAMLAVLLDHFRPSLLLLPTIAAGGDTPCHYPTAVWFHERLLPHLRFHGWYPGGYAGHPLLLYYFPFPFLVMSALAPLFGMPVAFKLGTALGVFLLPLLTYASFRLMGFRFPGPLLGAAASFVFLFLEENPIWGGTIASTLAGEFSYMYGLGFGVLFLGAAYRAYGRGARPWGPALLLALTALAHGYAVLWAGLSASFFLFGARQPRRTLLWLLAVAGLSFAVAAFWLLPLLDGWGWTTPYDDPWITIEPRNLFPPLLWPLFAAAAAGLAGSLLLARRTGGADRRLLFLLHAAAVGGALTAAGPALGIIDVRFAPFAQLSLCLLGAAALGLALQGLQAVELAGLGLALLAMVHAEAGSRLARSWIDWNYTGLEGKELWPAWREMTARLRAGVADPRVSVEYGKVHEKAGSIRMYETLPLFSGRSTLEGVYNQASLQTHFVYYLASELFESSPNPFRRRHYSRFDTEAALAHLPLYNVSEVVAVSEKLAGTLRLRPGIELSFRVPPYSVFRLTDARRGYVEPLAYTPVRSSPRDWREKAYRWFTREPLSPAHLVFTDDRRLALGEEDEWLAPPAVPLATGVNVSERVEDESLTITTDRVGHPLLVKISYHPRWKAEGADGPYLITPALMMVVPRQREVRLFYARTAADHLGLALTLAALGLGGALAASRRWRARQRRRAAGEEAASPPAAPGGEAVLSRLAAQLAGEGGPRLLDACDLPAPPRRWGWAIPTALLLLLCGGRLRREEPAADLAALHEKASRAYAAERFEDAAEYARHGVNASAGSNLRAELLVLRGESLLRASRWWPSLEAFETVINEGGAYVPQALFGAGQARKSLGDGAAAAAFRNRLLQEYGHTPWAERARTELPAS